MKFDQIKGKLPTLLCLLRARWIPILMTAGFLLLVVLHFFWPGFEAEPVAITLTGIVIIWYTWETNRLKIEMQRQTALMLKPYVIASPGGGNLERWRFNLVNVGNGSAVAVGVFQSERELNNKVPLLQPKGDSHPLELNIKEEPNQFYLTVAFSDIESNRYSIRSHIDKTKGVHLLSVEELHYQKGIG